MNKKAFYISTILILLIIVEVYFVNKLLYKSAPLIVEDISTTSDWKIYKDTKYGFEIKYPPTWTMSDNLINSYGIDKMFCPPELTDKNGECMEKETFGHMPDSYAPILFFQIPGNELDSNNPKYRVLGTKNDFKYELVLTNSSYSNEYELMISSFKFITSTTKSATTSKVVTTSKSATTSKAATIKVISPNGGEGLEAGSYSVIKWTTSDNSIIKSVSIILVKKDSLSPYNSAKIKEDFDSKINSYLWNTEYTYSTLYDPTNGDSVLEFPSPGQYVIRVCDLQTKNCDESDNYFTILPSDSKKQITVLSPNGEEKWVDKSVHQIVWSNNSTTTNLVDLYLWDDLKCGPYGINLPVYPSCPQAYIVLDKNINTNSIYNWIVGTDIKNNNIVPGKYKVAVCKAGDFDCDFSDSEFKIISK